jgi:hypothetical protein
MQLLTLEVSGRINPVGATTRECGIALVASRPGSLSERGQTVSKHAVVLLIGLWF